MKFKKSLIIILAAVLGITSLSGCHKNEEGNTGVSAEKKIAVPYTNYVATTNPIFYQVEKTAFLGNLVYSPLFIFDGDDIKNCLADFVEFKDNKELTITLRKGLKWQDGADITAEDIVYTFNKIMDAALGSPLKEYLMINDQPISIEKIDDLTVKITLPVERADFLHNVSRIPPIPKHIFETMDSIPIDEPSLMSVGSGPYKLTEFLDGDKASLEKYDNFYGGRPKIDRIEVKSYSTREEEEKALAAGELTLIKSPVDKILSYKENDNFKVYQYDDGRVNCIIFNQNNELMKDIDVRHGISYALNRKELIKAAYGDEKLSVEAKSVFHPAADYYRDENLEEYNFDTEKASKLLERFNGKLQNIKIAYNIEESVYKAYAEKAGEQLSNLGYKVVVEGYDANEFYKLINSSDSTCALYVTGYTLGMNPDAYKVIFKTGSYYNHTGYSNLSVDKLWEDGYNEIDNEKRREIYSEIQEMINADEPVYLIDYETSYLVTDKKLNGVEDARITPVLIFEDWSKLSIKD